MEIKLLKLMTRKSVEVCQHNERQSRSRSSSWCVLTSQQRAGKQVAAIVEEELAVPVTLSKRDWFYWTIGKRKMLVF